jgi:ATP phosphoribosyltransferase regulatory subunit
MSARALIAEPVVGFDTLQGQARRILDVFERAGHEPVAPSVIQPAGVFLDGIGEALRARTYVFTDPGGAELCLRPDLTVPVCRLHLERDPTATRPARYAYNGVAFRYQPTDAGPAHPREFRQAGIEEIGAWPGLSAEASDARCLGLVVDAIEAAGLPRDRLAIRTGDLALGQAVLAAVDMPRRWRVRLAGLFGRPTAFRAEVQRLSTTPGSHAAHLPRHLCDALAATHDTATAVGDRIAIVAAHLDARGLEPVGARTVAELAESLAALARDGVSRPLDPAATAAIERYIGIDCALADVPAALDMLAHDAGLAVEPAVAAVATRITALREAGIDPVRASFSGEFGRALGYYTGFVFDIGVPGAPATSPIAGGGRYDRLMATCGAPVDVPAVGAAIHTQRLLAAVGSLGGPRRTP